MIGKKTGSTHQHNTIEYWRKSCFLDIASCSAELRIARKDDILKLCFSWARWRALIEWKTILNQKRSNLCITWQGDLKIIIWCMKTDRLLVCLWCERKIPLLETSVSGRFCLKKIVYEAWIVACCKKDESEVEWLERRLVLLQMANSLMHISHLSLVLLGLGRGGITAKVVAVWKREDKKHGVLHVARDTVWRRMTEKKADFSWKN